MDVSRDLELDVLAVGAHPDDVEIACGGTLARLASLGYKVGIVDLTDGEPTPNSPGPDVRLEEARRAGEILGVAVRLNLNLPNRRLFDSFESRLALGLLVRVVERMSGHSQVHQVWPPRVSLTDWACATTASFDV